MVITDEKKTANLISGYFVNTTKKAKFKTLSTINCDCNLHLFQNQISITKIKEIYLEIDANSFKLKRMCEMTNPKSWTFGCILVKILHIFFDVYLLHQEC